MMPWKALAPAMMAAAALFVAGCGINRRYANNTIHQLPHSQIVIHYTVKEQAIQTVSAEDAAPEAEQSAAHQTLSIVYPHPNPKFGRAFADVTLRAPSSGEASTTDQLVHALLKNPFREGEAASGPGSPAGSSALHTALTQEELEFLLRDLVADGFFDRGERTGSIDLAVTLGSRSIQKRWDRVTALERLIQRVWSDNQHKTRDFGAAPKAPPPPQPDAPADTAVPGPQQAAPLIDPVKF